MESKIFVGSLLMMLMMGSFCSSSQANKFYVGGRDGWVVKPSESYSHWAERTRFQVNDTLVFKYKKGSDSVLVVSKDDYSSCNTKTPTQSLTEGDSIFKFDHSGPFYFISGSADSCNKGQKLVVVVLAVRHKPSTPPSPAATPTPSPSPSMTPSPSPSATPLPSPSPAVTSSPSPSPAVTPSPSPSPAPSPAAEFAPAPAPSSSGLVVSHSVGLVLGSLALSVVFGGRFVGMF